MFGTRAARRQQNQHAVRPARVVELTLRSLRTRMALTSHNATAPNRTNGRQSAP
jgi:hypothetical protein